MEEREEKDHNEHEILSESEQEFQTWKKSAPILYDTLITHTLEAPTFCVELLDDLQEHEEGYRSQLAMIGLSTSDSEHWLKLMNLRLPSEKINGKEGPFKTGFNCFEMNRKISHSGAINAIRHRGQNVATFSSEGKVFLFNLSNQDAPIAFTGPKEEGFGLDWEPEGNRLLAGSNDSHLYVWSIDGSRTEPQVLECGYGKLVYECQFHRRNPSVLGAVVEDCSLNLFDLRRDSNQPFLKLTAHPREVLALDFSPSNEFLLLTGAADGSIKLWDLRFLGEDLHEFSAHTESITRLRWCPNNETLFASASADKKVIMWDCAQIGEENETDAGEETPSELLFHHAGHRGPVTDFAWNPHTELALVSADEEKYLQYWEIDNNIYYKS